jgi:hypothetical protein
MFIEPRHTPTYVKVKVWWGKDRNTIHYIRYLNSWCLYFDFGKLDFIIFSSISCFDKRAYQQLPCFLTLLPNTLVSGPYQQLPCFRTLSPIPWISDLIIHYLSSGPYHPIHWFPDLITQYLGSWTLSPNTLVSGPYHPLPWFPDLINNYLDSRSGNADLVAEVLDNYWPECLSYQGSILWNFFLSPSFPYQLPHD